MKLRGLAYTNNHVAEYMANLAKSPLFKEVVFVLTEDTVYKDVKLRAFELEIALDPAADTRTFGNEKSTTKPAEAATKPVDPAAAKEPATKPVDAVIAKPTEPAAKPVEAVIAQPTEPAAKPVEAAIAKPTDPAAAKPIEPATKPVGQ